ncbi:MAG TPA: protoporphyrinogen oxidase [Clostridia bacterium]|nr:protoporphyrinogen oxidase [Clostridia bacterium]
MKKVIVVGAGMAGLAAAYYLEKARQVDPSVDYLLLEQDRRTGGKILTERSGNFVIEGGPDCFLAEKPAVFRLSRELGIYHELLGTTEKNKGTYVFSGGRVHRLPEGLMLMVPTKIIPFAFSPLISWPGKLRMGLDLILPRRRGEGDESLAGFVTRRLGREALDKIAEPLIGGIHAGDPEEMSIQASFPRFLEMEEKYGSLIRAMLAARKQPKRSGTGKPGSPRITYFMSFQKGLGQLTGEVAGRLDPEKVRLDCRVAGVAREDDGSYRVKLASGEILKAQGVILAIPAYEASRVIGDQDPLAGELLARIPAASSATITLSYKKSAFPRPLEGFGLLVPQVENRKIMAITYTSRKWQYRPAAGEEDVLLRVFIGGARNQHLVTLDEERLLRLVQDELKSILGISAQPGFYRCYRWVRGMPQYTLGHLERMDVIRQRISLYPGLYLIGASYDGVGIPNCIEAGNRAVEEALIYLGKRAKGL